MRASEVLDAHGRLGERLKDEPEFRNTVAHMVGSNIFKPGDDMGFQARMDRGLRLTHLLSIQLATAYTYRVTHDMCEVLIAAANGLDDSDMFMPQLAPTGAGFVRLDKALPVTDIRGKEMLVHFLVWGPAVTEDGVTGTCMWMFNDPWTEPDYAHLEFRERARDEAANPKEAKEAVEQYDRIVGQFSAVGLNLGFPGDVVGPQMTSVDAEMLVQYKLIAQDDRLDETHSSSTNTLRYLHALWLLLNQTIAVQEDEHVERPALKRAKRRNLIPKVTVIKMRRSEHPPHIKGDSLIDWQYRWIVRSHWAWRICGADHPGAQPYKGGWAVRKWIHFYEKGPEDKPLVVTDKVISLER
jgi:hypothetical protein